MKAAVSVLLTFLLLNAVAAISPENYRVWSDRHQICRSAHGNSNDKPSSTTCKDAPYYKYVAEELKNVAQWNGTTAFIEYKLALLHAIESLYVDLDKRIAPYVVCAKVHGGCDRTLHITPQNITKYGGDFVVMNPISFAIPERFVVGKTPVKGKAFGRVIPGVMATYYKSSEEILYRQDMSESYFSITYRKQGFDCLRHTEILASGSIPLFTDIHRCYQKALMLHPKELYSILLRTPGLDIHDELDTPQHVFFYGEQHKFDKLALDMDKMDMNLYMTTSAALLQYTRNVLTTVQLAAYILNTVHTRTLEMDLSEGGIVPSLPSSILYLQANYDNTGDYQVDLVLHGLKQLLGDDVVTDFPRNAVLYQTSDLVDKDKYLSRKGRTYGMGFTFALEIEDWQLQNTTSLTYAQVQQQLMQRAYDMVILAGVHRDFDYVDHKQQKETLMPHFDTVCATYPRSKVVWIDGGDQSRWNLGAAEIAKAAKCAGHLFSREGPRQQLILT